MSIEWLIDRLGSFGESEAFVDDKQSRTFSWLTDEIRQASQALERQSVSQGAVVAIVGDYSPRTCAVLLALVHQNAIVVPLASAISSQHDKFMQIAEVQFSIRFRLDDTWSVERTEHSVNHPLLLKLRDTGAPGLVLFSSGSTGDSKAILHDLEALLEKFRQARPPLRTLAFLLLDHIGGINTLFYILSSGATLISSTARSPEDICAVVEKHKVQLIPTSPSFLNLLLASEAHKRHDLSSLKLITYGTEVMPPETLRRLNELFPNIRFHQTYGLSELGILRSKSRDSSSLWMKVGGEGFETKIKNGTLWIRAQSAMMGYLNAPNPFDAEGWFDTGDEVESDGEYIRVLGRDSEIINVGGEKVYPAEIEGVLLGLDNVKDVLVYGEPHPLTGQVVVAEVALSQPEELLEFKSRLRQFCKLRLERFKIPAKVVLARESRVSPRFKKTRPTGSDGVS